MAAAFVLDKYGNNAAIQCPSCSKAFVISQLCDTVLLVLLDNATLEPREMREAPYSDVCKLLSQPGSKSRDRGSLGVPAFKAIAERVWASQ